MSELIKRLRDDRHIYIGRPLNEGELRIWHLLCCEAADVLEAKDIEIARLELLIDTTADNIDEIIAIINKIPTVPPGIPFHWGNNHDQ